jgi:hypothetical protein
MMASAAVPCGAGCAVDLCFYAVVFWRGCALACRNSFAKAFLLVGGRSSLLFFFSVLLLLKKSFLLMIAVLLPGCDGLHGFLKK